MPLPWIPRKHDGRRLRSGPCFLVCCVLAVAGAACAAGDADRPNFVVIVVDDLRWDDLGIAGHPFVETPGIDRLAREGVRFRNAFATTPLCSPSRAAILTGQYVHTQRDHRQHRPRCSAATSC